MSKTIRGIGGLGSGALFGPERVVLWRAGDGGKRDMKKKGEKSPWGNLAHCGKKSGKIINLIHFSIQMEISLTDDSNKEKILNPNYF